MQPSNQTGQKTPRKQPAGNLLTGYANGGEVSPFSLKGIGRSMGLFKTDAEIMAERKAAYDKKQAKAPAPETQEQSQASVAPRGSQSVLDRRMKEAGLKNGGKIKGPGTPTSDSIPAKVEQTGEPIRVSTGERIVSAAQDALLQRIAKARGFDSVDHMFEVETGKPVGPTIKGGKRAALNGMPAEDQDGYLPGEGVMARAGRRLGGVVQNLAHPEKDWVAKEGSAPPPAPAAVAQPAPAAPTTAPTTPVAPAPVATAPAGQSYQQRQGQLASDQNAYHGDMSSMLAGNGKLPQDLSPLREGSVYKTTGKNGSPIYSGVNVTGDAPMVRGDGTQIQGKGSVSSVPGMSKELIDKTLTNPDGTRWTAADNATMAANLRDGVDKYRGTSQDPALQANRAVQSKMVNDTAKTAADTAGAQVATEGALLKNTAAKQVHDLQQSLLNEADPAKRKEIERKLIVMGGKEPNDKGQIINLPDSVGEMGQAIKGGQAILMPDGSVRLPNGTVLNFNQQSGGGIHSDPRALAIKNNANMSREQKIAELKKIGFQ